MSPGFSFGRCAGASLVWEERRRAIERWRMSWWSAPSGATKARARSSIGCRSAPTSSCASRAAITPATRWWSTARSYKLALLPSGIVRPGKLSVIGNGVVLDPYHLVEEIEKLRGQGVEVTPANLKIAENVPLILSLHRELDAHRESGDGARHQDRHHQARHRPGLRGQGRPARDPADGPRRAGFARRQDRPAARPP